MESTNSIEGANNPEQMREKVALANSFVAMDEPKCQALIDKVADLAGTTDEFYKA